MGKSKGALTDAWHKSMYDRTLAATSLASKEFEVIARGEAKFLMRAMGLAAGETLLDVPCGTGRHARFFADAGLLVTGVDLSEDCIHLARRSHRRKELEFRVGNMAELREYRNRFDAVVNLFTSFGYFATEARNFAVLKGMVAALKPGGRLAIQLIDRDWLLRNFEACVWREAKKIFTLESRRYDARTKRIEAQTVILDEATGRAKRYYHQTRLYSKTEMTELLRRAGLRSIRVYGDTDGALFRKGESSHPTYIGWKPARGTRSTKA